MEEEKKSFKEELISSLWTATFITGIVAAVMVASINNVGHNSKKDNVSVPSGDYVSDDGKYLLKLDGNRFFVFDNSSGKMIKSFQLSGNDACISEENRWIKIEFYPILEGENTGKGYNCVMRDRGDTLIIGMIKKK